MDEGTTPPDRRATNQPAVPVDESVPALSPGTASDKRCDAHLPAGAFTDRACAVRNLSAPTYPAGNKRRPLLPPTKTVTTAPASPAAADLSCPDPPPLPPRQSLDPNSPRTRDGSTRTALFWPCEPGDNHGERARERGSDAAARRGRRGAPETGCRVLRRAEPPWEPSRKATLYKSTLYETTLCKAAIFRATLYKTTLCKGHPLQGHHLQGHHMQGLHIQCLRIRGLRIQGFSAARLLRCKAGHLPRGDGKTPRREART